MGSCCNIEVDAAEWAVLVPALAKYALASGSPSNNPRVPTAAQIEDLYRTIYA